MNKFKEGNWVRQIKENYSLFNRIFKIKSILKNSNLAIVEDNIFGIDAINISSTVFELWQPKEGEYIWDKDYGLSIILSNDTNGVYCRHLFHQTNTHTTFTAALKDCQPFIGELPEF